MTTSLSVTVYGTPKPQGSKRAFVIKGKDGGKPRAVVTEDSRTGARDWRDDVRNTVLDALPYDWHRLDGPVHVVLSFGFDRPRSHHRTGRHAHQLKDSAPRYHTTKPDADKLARAILDALTAAGVYRDDSQVAHLSVTKSYVEQNERPGVAIIVDSLGEPSPGVAVIGEALTATPDTPTESLF